MEIRYALLLGVAMLVVVMYYVEKQVAKEQIFWIFSGGGVLFGLISAYAVANNFPMYDYYLTLTMLFVLIAVFYYDYSGEEKPKKKRKKKLAAPAEVEPARTATETMPASAGVTAQTP